MASTSNFFTNSFDEIYTSTFLDTCKHLSMLQTKGISQSALTMAQFIKANFCKNRDNELNVNCRIIKERESPEIINSTLKLYGQIRSNTIISQFFSLRFVIV